MRRDRDQAPAFAAGGMIVWAVLFAWRVGTARTSGANMFLAPLIVVVIPAALLVPAAVGALAAWRSRRD